jgi:DNA-binding GntR family transcriptional regulator
VIVKVLIMTRPGRRQLGYLRVADAIEAQIRSGGLPPGVRLPSEKDLALEHEVAVTTVRHALEVLRERGLIETAWGKGTYVRGTG